MMVLETMNIYMLDILKEGLYVPLRTITKEEKELVTLRALIHQLTEDEKKKVNFDVCVRAAICISFLYNVYHLVENYVYAKVIILTVKITYEGTDEVNNNLKNSIICKYE
ncbi:unnamed protein product [Lactuca saligna]|uniref:Uncharacterized protein n=1 Tax=Lactuca saligna TaxID=75948 RepID=A0AA35V3P5_LACSI|nr:unnamed protein product [Lactuca saligna]